jgi:uncharacterized membrane protein YbhN (UPF0104 family)
MPRPLKWAPWNWAPWNWGRWRWIAVPGVAGLALFLLRGKLPDVGEVWRSVTGANPGWLGVAIAAEMASMNTFARLFRRLLLLGGSRLSLPRVVAVTYARNAVSNSLPAGQVLSIAYTTREFGRLGAAKPLVAATLVLSGVYSTATFAVLSLAALLGQSSTRTATGIVLAVLAVVVPTLVKLRPRGMGAWLARRSPKVFDQVLAARAAITLAGRDLFVLAALALANWLLDVACLAAVCAAAGVSIGPHTILLGYVAAKAAAALALIPGGLGVAEIGMAATFIATGVTGGTAAAVVTLYRLISYWVILIAGWLAWLFLLEGFRARLRTAGHWLWRAWIQLAVSMGPYAIPCGYREPCN